MESRAKLVGHAVHPMLIVFPLGLLGMAAIFDLIRLNARAGAVDYAPNGLPIVLEVIGLLLALVTSWLGGELVERLGVGVDEGAHVRAPSSLSGRPARAGGEAPPVGAP